MQSLSEFEEVAKRDLDSRVWRYFSTGAGRCQTLKDNESAFLRYRLRPRVLQDVSVIDTATDILGENISFPVCSGATSMHKMAHSDGELATARAAAKAGTCMILGCFSNTAMEDVSVATGPGLRWLQLYIFKDRELTRDIVLRAKRAGYRAIVVTVDQPVVSNNTQASISPPVHLSLPVLGVSSPIDKDAVGRMIDPSVTWKDIDWIRGLTQLPIVLKGILTAEDAVEAVRHGVQGIIVSNHGGRQLDGVLASIDALSEVVKAVDGKVEVYMEGGVRQGSDVLKALALGARAVFIGRPVLWGLACGGQGGVGRVLEILKDEFTSSMALTGCKSIADIEPSRVSHDS